MLFFPVAVCFPFGVTANVNQEGGRERSFPTFGDDALGVYL